jgi:hypothetical protein
MTTQIAEPPNHDQSSRPEHRLLAPFTPEQQAVVDLLAKVWMEHGEWPNLRYVEHEMDRLGFALETVLPTFPSLRVIGSHPVGAGYQAVWYDGLGGAPDSRVGLTVAGLAHLPVAGQNCLAFLRLLQAMATYFLNQPVDPFQVEDLDLSLLDLVHQAQIADEQWAGWIVPIFDHEPATWGGNCGTAPDGATRWRYRRTLRHFMEPEMNVSAYLWCLDAYLAPPRPDLVVESIPPLSLLAALDFLDVVWLLRYKTRLLRLPSAVAAASLSEEAHTADEFDARLSALGQVLKGLSVPRTKGANHPVQFFAAKLLADLPPESHERVQRSIAVLEAAVLVRNAQQHAHAAPDSVNALGALGLTYPVTEWASAWVTIRNGVTTALWAIREELQGSLESDEEP